MWQHPALAEFDYFMRVDADLYILKPLPYDPFAMMHSKGYAYMKILGTLTDWCVDASLGLTASVVKWLVVMKGTMMQWKSGQNYDKLMVSTQVRCGQSSWKRVHWCTWIHLRFSGEGNWASCFRWLTNYLQVACRGSEPFSIPASNRLSDIYKRKWRNIHSAMEWSGGWLALRCRFLCVWHQFVAVSFCEGSSAVLGSAKGRRLSARRRRICKLLPDEFLCKRGDAVLSRAHGSEEL